MGLVGLGAFISLQINSTETLLQCAGGSPGQVVMGIVSRSKGRGFESRHCIWDGHFFIYICCKNCNVCLKIPKINEKEAGDSPFLK